MICLEVSDQLMNVVYKFFLDNYLYLNLAFYYRFCYLYHIPHVGVIRYFANAKFVRY